MSTTLSPGVLVKRFSINDIDAWAASLPKEEDFFKFKADKGKNQVGLFCEDFANALWAVGEVAEYGTRKYAESTWKDVPDALKRYRRAFMRHYNAYLRGEKRDEESGHLHLTHAFWCMAAILELEIKNDDNT
jgi:hypothetical protein